MMSDKLRAAAQAAYKAMIAAELSDGSKREWEAAVDGLKAALAETQMPTKIFGPNLEEILNAAGFYKKKESKKSPVAWIYDFLNPDDREEIIRDWMTQDYSEIEREKGFNVRPLYAEAK